MAISDIFPTITDTYDRQARLYPAILVAAPILAVSIGVYGVRLDSKNGVLSLIASLGLLYLAMTISREMGKRLETKLFKLWGGTPTTQLLRHRDTSLDPITKARYHAFLAAKLKTKFPDPEQERIHPDQADHHYASGARWLLDQTRDKKKFPLLFKELVAYGFRRNSLGLKPLGITSSVLAIAWLIAASGVATLEGLNLEALRTLPMNILAVALIELGFLAIWVLFISRRTVRSSAFMYADLLLRACDKLR